jgi:phospholipid-binding lipoprotein MlaA
MMMIAVRFFSIAALVGAAAMAAAQTSPAPAASDAAAAPAPAPEMPGDNAPPAANPADPFEGFNRGIFSFNEGLDKAILKPVAETYRKVVPQPVRNGVSNVFGNVGDAWSAVNQMLQGKVQNSLEMGMRVAMNSVFGLGGLLDPASEAGLERRSEDFGQTLGVWGFNPGPYLVLPVFGPSSVRDGLALPVNQVASPGNYISPTGAAVGVTVLGVVDTRAGLLNLTNLASDLALDKYSFYRDAYIARRLNQVYDGNPPEPAPEPAPPGASSETKSEPR